MSLSSALSTVPVEGTRTFLASSSSKSASSSSSTAAATGSRRHHHKKHKEASNRRGSATMITLAATAGSDVVAAIGNTATIATSPATAEPMAATSGLPAPPTTTTTTSVGPAVGTAVNTPTSGILGSENANNNPNSLSLSNRTNAMTTRPTTIRRRHKVKEFNDLISCSLCSGYLINATTIDHCGHSYCRSCIVRHCKISRQCPKCGKQMSLSNLRSDGQLQKIVYKVVPGLYHEEIQRQLQHTEGKDEAVNYEYEEDFFSPVEPISLSLEYHPNSLANCSKDQIPYVRYLQCPAAVTVHHLKRFISSKFNINMENSRVDIEIIYDEEILRDDFSLMDVGYCYSWKRDCPMRFFYRILVHSVCNNPEQVTNTSNNISSKTEENVEAKCTKKVKEEVTSKRKVHFKAMPLEPVVKQPQASSTTTSAAAVCAPKCEKVETITELDDDDDDDDEVTAIDESYKNTKTTYAILKPKNLKNEELHSLSHNNNNNNGLSHKHRKDKDKHSPEVHQKESVKVTIIARKGNVEAKVKSAKTKSKRSSSPKSPDSTPSSDFKSLRSNDVRYSNDYSATITSASTKQHKSKSTSKEISKPVTPKCDIFVSIPQSGHRSSNSSDDSSENLSLAQLKTASKKNSNTVTLKQSISLDESLLSKPKATKLDVPKLKITVPKKSPTTKIRKLSVDQPSVEHVDLTTYAKHIGLKPINPTVEEKKEIKIKISPGNSPSSSVSSSSASSPPSAATDTGFVFNTDVSSSHKKRKKAKHSKEPKDPSSKKRRLHAEISSPAAEESLKLKVKITGNPKSYKAERKVSTSSDEVIITSPIVTSAPNTAVTSTTTSVNNTKTIQNHEQKPPASPKLIVSIATGKKSKLENSNSISASSVKISTEPTPVMKEQKSVKENAVSKSSTPPNSVAQLNTKPASPITTPATTTSGISSIASAKQFQSPKLQNIQDTKLPASPPLPPSLFKTAPMALQPLTLGPPKTPTPSSNIQPKLGLTTPDTNGIGLNRLVTSSRPASTFAIPNPPRTLPISPKLSPISSIASNANRQAQLKRSASLDASPSTVAKQQKIDRTDTMMRKASYTPFLGKVSSPAAAATTPTGNGLKTLQRNSPPIAITSNTVVQKPTEQTYYTSPMANTYTREIQTKKPTPIMLPPSSISVTKMPDVITGNLVTSPAGLTITPQTGLSQTPLIQQHIQQQQKPALEIVRIQSNIPPIDQQKLTITNNNTIKPNPPKTTRPLPPTIPLVKIKRSTNQMNPLKSTLTTVMAPIQQQAILNNNLKVVTGSVSPPTPVNGVNNKVENKTADGEKDSDKRVDSPKVSNVCDTTGVLDLSGKSSRSPSQDKNSPPLTPTSISQNSPQMTSNLTPGTIEAALNKLKQQTSLASPTSTTPSTGGNCAVTSNSTVQPSLIMPTTKPELLLTDTSNKPITPLSPISSTALNSNSLQNLKMLSDSATSREKIAIKTQRPLAPVPKLNEMSKVRQPATTVRQQNASVRNIPNPSALTLRGQQVPMLTSLSKTSTTVSKTTTSLSNTLTTSAAGSVSESSIGNDTKSPATTSTTIAVSPMSFSNSLAKPSSPASSTTSSNLSDAASKLLVSKKNLHLEQLAASLNMRAAAAAGETSSLAKNTTQASSPTASTTSFISTLSSSVPVTSSSAISSSSISTSLSTSNAIVSYSPISMSTASSSVVSTTTNTPVISATTT